MQRFQRFYFSFVLVLFPLLATVAQLDVSVEIEHVACYGSSNACAMVSISGGTSPYDITWHEGGKGHTRCGYNAGEHFVLVKDSDGLEKFVGFNVLEPEVFIAGFTITTPETCLGCNDGKLTLEFYGGTGPFKYQIGGQDYSSEVRIVESVDMAPGVWTVMAIDNNGCASSSSAIVDPH